MSFKKDIIEAEVRTSGGHKVQAELGKINKSILELKDTNKNLKYEMAKLEAQGKKGTKAWKALQEQYRKNNNELDIQRGKLKEVTANLKLTDMSASQLRKRASELRRELSGVSKSLEPQRWSKLNKQLIATEAQMGKVRHGTNRTKSAMIGLKKVIVALQYGTIIGLILTVVNGIKKWGTSMATLDDALAGVMKTTGMAKKEARSLYKEFDKLNTRTPRNELLALAEEAGRLGKKSKKDVMDFVEVANKISVALGDDLGGDTALATKEIGKLTNIYKVGEKYGTDFKNSMEKVGSAINEVSANSNAQADYLIGYMKRMGGVAVQADVNASQIIGYASALDQLGQTQEMAATAQGKVMIDMFTDQAKYAEIANIKVDDFSKLLKSDANEAFLKFLEGLNGNNKGLTVMATKLDDLGIDGTRAIQVLTSLASNTERVRKEQALASKAMKEGISLTNEYNIINNNFAGSIAKIGQFLKNKLMNPSFLGWLEKGASKMAEWTKVPMTETLKNQRFEMNKLVMQITGLNHGDELRLKLINKLVKTYPDYWGQIDKATISNNELLASLQNVNRQMIRQIYIEGRKEELRELQENASGKLAIERQYHDQLESIKTSYFSKMGEQQQALFTGDFDFIMQHFKKLQDTSNNHMQWVMRTEAWLDRQKLGKRYKGGLDFGDMVKLVGSYSDWKEAYKDKYNAEKDAKKEWSKINKIEKTWGIDNIGSNNSSDGSNSGSTGDDEELKKTIEAEQNLANAIKSIKQQLNMDKLSADQKEIAQVEAKYKKLIDQAKADGLDTKELEALKQEELTTLTLKHEEKRKKAKEAAHKVLQDATMSADEKEKQQKIEKYQELLALAEQYGFDTTEMYTQLKDELNAIMNGGEDGEEQPTGSFFGMSGEDLEGFLDTMGEVIEYAEAMRDGLGSIFEMANNADQKKFDKEKKRANERKKFLKNQLDNDVISQEAYNKRVEKIDVEMEKKKEELDKKKAKREKVMGVLSVGINTAKGIMNAVVAAPPLTGGMPWTAIIAALGALQMGAVLSAPGLEKGGFHKVRRAQDNKEFYAKYDPYKRGFIDKPTVLVSERKGEFVANGEAVENPTIRPVLDVIDAAQKSGTISTLNLPAVIQNMSKMRGLESGGYSQQPTQPQIVPEYSDVSEPNADLSNLIHKAVVTIEELNDLIRKGINAKVIYGDIEDKMNEVKTIRTAANL